MAAPAGPPAEVVADGAARIIDALATHVAPGNIPTLGGAGYDLESGYDAETWSALRDLKARMDPDNRLRFNLNVPPTAG